MDLSARIFVAGHRGLMGSAIVRRLKGLGYTNLIFRKHEELRLEDWAAVHEFMQKERPNFVFLAAARVGGIQANLSYPAEFILENLLIEVAVIDSAYRTGVQRLLFLGSSCIYPRSSQQPILEDYFLTGSLESTNRPYAIAKIAGIELCWSYNRQYGTKYLAAMPTNLYGIGDQYDPVTSHVIPGLIYRFHQAKDMEASEVKVWGTGSPRREFLNSDDAADACVFLMNLPDAQFDPMVRSEQEPPLINVGTGSDLTIAELANLIAEVVGLKASIIFDPAMPDGTPRKLLDNSKLTRLGWKSKGDLVSGLREAYDDFLARFPSKKP
jgi:GDP-L-fucose synthase